MKIEILQYFIHPMTHDLAFHLFFNDKDVVRHSLVQKIVNAYERLEKSIEKPR